MKLPTIGRRSAEPTAVPVNARPKQRQGRATPSKKSGRVRAGRYTEPIPRTVRRSPQWYPFMLLGFLLLGVLVIILNYIGALPDSPTNWYTLGALVSIVVGALLATGYH